MITPPFPAGFEFAPGADLTAPGGWLYEDLTSRWRESTPIEFEYGQPDESGSVEAGSGAVTFDDRDAELSPWNPLSEWYGRLQSNAPARVRVPLWADTFDRAVVAAGGWGTSTSGHVWSTADSKLSTSGTAGTWAATAANQSTFQYLKDAGGVGVGSRGVVAHVTASLDAVTVTGSVVVAPMLRRVTGANTSYVCYFKFHPTGFITLTINRNVAGGFTNIASATTTVAWAPGAVMHFEFEADGPVLRARCWKDGGSAPAWQCTVVENKIDGWGVGLLFWREPAEASAGTRTVTVYDVTFDSFPWSGYAADLPPGWDKSGNDSTTVFELAGPLRTLTQLNSEEDPRSPMYRRLSGYGGYGLSGMWGCEDDSGSTSAASAVGGPAAECSGVSFGNDAPAGAKQSAKFDVLGAKFRATSNVTSPNQFAAMLLIKFPQKPTVDTLIYEWLSPSGTAIRWQVWANGTGFRVLVVNNIGVTLSDTGYLSYVVNPLNWLAMQVEATVSAGTVSYVLLYTEIGVNVFWVLSGSFSGTLAGVRTLQMSASTAELVDLQWCMVWMGGETLPFVADSFIKVANGYVNELDGDRHDRLTSDEGVPSGALPGSTVRLGAQELATFPTLRAKTVSSGEGLEIEDGPGLLYLPLNSRYNAPTVLQLEWSGDDGEVTGGDLAEAPKPAAGDQRYVSQYTVKRTDGTEATWFADPVTVALRGRKKGSAELSLADDTQPEQHAGWRGNAAVWPDLRWPTIVLDLAAHPELIDAVARIRIGSRITVVGMKAPVFGQEIDLVVEAVAVVLGSFQWDVTLTCAPARIFDVAIYDDDTRLMDSRTTTLAAAAGPGNPSLSLTFTNKLDQWSQTNLPYSALILGEEVVFRSVGAVTGSGPWTQAVVADRAVNGISKELPAGSPVHIHPRVIARYAL